MEAPILDDFVSSMVVRDIDIDGRWTLSGCRWKKRTRGWDKEGKGEGAAALASFGSRCGQRTVRTTRHFTQYNRKSNQAKSWERGREGIRGGQEKPLRQ